MSPVSLSQSGVTQLRWRRWAAWVVLAGVSQSGCREATPSGPSPAVVGAVEVVRGELRQTLLVSGHLVSLDAVRIAVPRVGDGGPVTIQAIASEGALVHPGDLLLQIDSAVLIDRLAAERLSRDEAQTELKRRSAQEETQLQDLTIAWVAAKREAAKTALRAEIAAELLALRDWQQNQFEHRRALKKLEKSRMALDLARRAGRQEVALLQVRLSQISKRIERIESDLASLTIRAASEGTVLYESTPRDPLRKFQVGDQVSPGTVVLSVPNLGRTGVRIEVSEVDGGSVRPGQKATVVLDGWPEREIQGVVESLPEVPESRRRDSDLRFYLGLVRLDALEVDLRRPGMSARVEIELGRRSGLLLPRSAVILEGTQPWVHLDSGDRRRIRVVGRTASECLVEGLAEGDRVTTWSPVGRSDVSMIQ